MSIGSLTSLLLIFRELYCYSSREIKRYNVLQLLLPLLRRLFHSLTPITQMKRTLLLSLLILVSATCASLNLEAQVKKASPPIAFLQRFYTAYIRSVDRMLEQDQRDSIIATALSPEMQEKTHRLVAATGIDPILRQQDTRSGLEKTFRARQLKGDWYEVSLGGAKELVRIPLHVKQVSGRYIIDFITPLWRGEEYGDHLMANPLASSTSIDNSSEEAFILSFYRRYLSAYLSMSRDMGAILSQLREQYCTLETIGLHRERMESGDLEDGYYDVLIDHVDFDPAWVPSLQVRPRTGGEGYEITYTQSTESQPIQHVIPVRAIKLDGGGYRLHVLREGKPLEVTPVQAPEEVKP